MKLHTNLVKMSRAILATTLLSITFGLSISLVPFNPQNKGEVQTAISRIETAKRNTLNVSRGAVERETPIPIVTPTPTNTSVPTPAMKLIGTFKVSAYDLSVQSCGKSRSNKYYGKTFTGFSLVGKDIKDRKIAVDPRIIRLYSKVYIEFINMKHIDVHGETVELDSTYQAIDTGSAIRGNKIDLYMGEDYPGEMYYNSKCDEFGVQKARIYTINK